jgi:hypothetical protein
MGEADFTYIVIVDAHLMTEVKVAGSFLLDLSHANKLKRTNYLWPLLL